MLKFVYSYHIEEKWKEMHWWQKWDVLIKLVIKRNARIPCINTLFLHVGHRSPSGDLLLFICVCCRSSSVEIEHFNFFITIILILFKLGMTHLWDMVDINCKFQDFCTPGAFGTKHFAKTWPIFKMSLLYIRTYVRKTNLNIF